MPMRRERDVVGGSGLLPWAGGVAGGAGWGGVGIGGMGVVGGAGVKAEATLVWPGGGAHESPLEVLLAIAGGEGGREPPPAAALPLGLGVISYTLDGSLPSCVGAGVSTVGVVGGGSQGVLMGGRGTITLANSTTLRVMSCLVGRLPSEVGVFRFALRAGAPTFAPPAGSFVGQVRGAQTHLIMPAIKPRHACKET